MVISQHCPIGGRRMSGKGEEGEESQGGLVLGRNEPGLPGHRYGHADAVQ